MLNPPLAGNYTLLHLCSQSDMQIKLRSQSDLWQASHCSDFAMWS